MFFIQRLQTSFYFCHVIYVSNVFNFYLNVFYIYGINCVIPLTRAIL